jgi:DNA-binding MarR family transcriptional regulator
VVYTTSVKRERHDRPVRQLPAGVVFSCVGYRVRRLSRVVSGIYDEALGPLKLKISQFSILVALDSRGRSTAVDLCRLLMMDKSTASRNLQRMRRRGWISIRADNGREQVLSLTSAGARVLQTAYPLWRRAQGEATRRLRADGLKALDTVMSRIDD